MLVNIPMKFHQDNLNGFQVTERTRLECKFCYFLFQRAITPKICNPKLWFLCSARRLMLVTDHVKFQVTLNGLQVTERKRFVTDRQTDGRTDGRTNDPDKNSMSPTHTGRRHNEPPHKKTNNVVFEQVRHKPS